MRLLVTPEHGVEDVSTHADEVCHYANHVTTDREVSDLSTVCVLGERVKEG